MKRSISRREFGATLMRSGLIGTIIGGAFALIKRNGIDRTAHTCSGGGICSGCGRAGACVLPQAVSRRDAQAKKRQES